MKRALVSVSDKTNLVPFVKRLVELGYEIISTGGTKKALEEAGVEVIAVDAVTGFPEILEGRVTSNDSRRLIGKTWGQFSSTTGG